MFRSISAIFSIFFLASCQTIPTETTSRFDGQWNVKFETTPHEICKLIEVPHEITIKNGRVNFNIGEGYERIQFSGHIGENNILQGTGYIFTLQSTNVYEKFRSPLMVNIEFKPYSAYTNSFLLNLINGTQQHVQEEYISRALPTLLKML